MSVDSSSRLAASQPIPFPEHVALLRQFLACRTAIVDRIDSVLNAQRKPVQYLQDRDLLMRLFEDCFFAPGVVTADQTRLRGQLEQAHWSGGFRPRQLRGLHNDLIHPGEMMTRGFHFWHVTRWPGGTGRAHYAQTLFNVYMLRCLEFLSVRLWDGTPGDAPVRLRDLQGILDQVWKTSPPEQPRIVRDARWLIPLAQSLPTDELFAYLEVARDVAETLPEADALEVQRAQVRMLGAHLTSQIRHYCTKDGKADALSIDEASVIRRTRTSNALDYALLIQGLVALLKAYDRALQVSDERARLDMAGAIFQGVSPDPELFLNRIDILGAYSMIEDLFVSIDQASGDGGHAGYSPLGQRHVRLLGEYSDLMVRLRVPLRVDAARFRPMAGTYSPYGAIFGTPSILTELMALKTLQRDAETRFSLEDAFDERGYGAAKLAWVDGWRKMPHVDPDVQRSYDYPQRFAEEIHARIERELGRAHADIPRTGRLNVASPETDPSLPELPPRYVVSTDPTLVAAGKAEHCDRTQLLHNRREAHYVVSYETPTGWIALKKDLLTDELAEGRNARIADLPPQVAPALRLAVGPSCDRILA